MNLLSFNIRGLGSSPKRDAHKILIEVINSRIIMLQDTMVVGNLGSLVTSPCQMPEPTIGGS